MNQIQIPFTNSPQVDKFCRWCGAPAKEQLVLEPERYRRIDGRKELAKYAVTAGVCTDCKKHMVFRNTEKPDTYKVKK